MELDEKFNLLRALTQKIRSYDKHLIDTVTFCNNKMSSIVYDYYPFEVEIFSHQPSIEVLISIASLLSPQS